MNPLYLMLKKEAWLAIPKNASTYLDSLGAVEISRETFLSTAIRNVYLRDPIERFYSAFQFFKTLFITSIRYSGFDLSITKNYEDFTDYALTHSDVHWRPQSKFMLDENKHVITNRHKRLMPNDSAVNQSHRFTFNKKYRLDDLQHYYQADNILFKELTWL